MEEFFFYTERIALTSSSVELYQIVDTFYDRQPPNVLQTIYPSAQLPSPFIGHSTNKVEKIRTCYINTCFWDN